MSAKPNIIKVKAFPVAAKVTAGSEVSAGQILKLTTSGFLVEAPILGLKTGAKFQIEFEIPVTREHVVETCVIVKLYTSVGSHMIEGHFQNLSIESERKIMRFLQNASKASRGRAT